MRYLLLTITAFILAITVNSTSVFLQKQHGIYKRFKYGMYVHGLVITPAWALFILLLSGLNRRYIVTIPHTGVVGPLLVLVSSVLFVAAVSKVGTQALLNGNFFKKVEFINTGVYRYVKNPIYDSYALLFIGLGLTLHNGSFLIIAIVNLIGLNVVESKIEQIKECPRG